MASLLITKGDDKLQFVVSINGKGIFYQELRLGTRPMSQRVRLGKLVVVDGEIIAEYDQWYDYDALVVERDTSERTKNAAKEVLKSLENNPESLALKKAEIDKLTSMIAQIEKKIKDHPVRSLFSLSAKVMSSVDKMLDKVRYKHQSIEKDSCVQFSHHPSKEYFLQSQAEDLLKRHNESLEVRDIHEGYLDFDAAMRIIQKRFAAMEAKKAPTKAKKSV